MPEMQNMMQEKHQTFENGWLYLSNYPLRDHAEKSMYLYKFFQQLNKHMLLSMGYRYRHYQFKSCNI